MRGLELIRTVAVVNADSLKVRDDASLDGAVLTQVPKGEELEVVEVLGDWVQVAIDSDNAYVSADMIDSARTVCVKYQIARLQL